MTGGRGAALSAARGVCYGTGRKAGSRAADLIVGVSGNKLQAWQVESLGYTSSLIANATVCLEYKSSKNRMFGTDWNMHLVWFWASLLLQDLTYI